MPARSYAERAARFQRHDREPRDAHRARDDVRGRGERGFDVAAAPRVAHDDVVGSRLVQPYRTRQRGPNVDQRVQRFVRDLDQLRRVFGRGPRLGDDRGNDLADVADGVRGEDRMQRRHDRGVRKRPRRRQRPARKIACAQHGDDAGRGPCGARIDLAEPSVRVCGLRTNATCNACGTATSSR